MDIPSMTRDELHQCYQMFFRCGLYWDPPHPAVSAIEFPCMTITKNTKTLAKEKEGAKQRKEKRKIAQEHKVKKVKVEQAIPPTPPTPPTGVREGNWLACDVDSQVTGSNGHVSL